MEVQVVRVRGCKIMKKMANKQFKMLCADYNKVYKIIDTLKEMLNSGDYKKGDIDSFPTAIQAIQAVLVHTSIVSEDLEKTIEELVKRLRDIDMYKERYMISPLLAIRLEHMSDLVIYLREVKKEVDLIADEIGTIIDKIANIEELEELNFYE
jgi:hypothetical protein